MSRDLLIAQLRQGSTGDEILEILDVIINDFDSDDETVEELEF